MALRREQAAGSERLTYLKPAGTGSPALPHARIRAGRDSSAYPFRTGRIDSPTYICMLN